MALAGAPLAVACTIALGNLGIWVAPPGVPPILVVLLYFATDWAVIFFVFGGLAAVVVGVIFGAWYQRVVVALASFTYIPHVIWLAPYIWQKIVGR